jgi:hypothetical protein
MDGKMAAAPTPSTDLEPSVKTGTESAWRAEWDRKDDRRKAGGKCDLTKAPRAQQTEVGKSHGEEASS